VVDALAAIYGIAAFLLVMVAFRDAPVRWLAARREERVIEDRLYHAVNAISILVIAAWVAVVLTGFDRSLPAGLGAQRWARGLGLGLGLAGFGLASWARVAIGKAFAPTAAVPPDRRIVDEGPFGHVRHPFYLGMLVAMAGGVLVLDSQATLVAWLALVPLVDVLARWEEAFLVEELGPTYSDYREHVPRWLPRP
jgi:protein-S-isoprenylcysteine O-methyltransferase Ste14